MKDEVNIKNLHAELKKYTATLDELTTKRAILQQAQAKEIGAIDNGIMQARNKISVLVSMLPD